MPNEFNEEAKMNLSKRARNFRSCFSSGGNNQQLFLPARFRLKKRRQKESNGNAKKILIQCCQSQLITTTNRTIFEMETGNALCEEEEREKERDTKYKISSSSHINVGTATSR